MGGYNNGNFTDIVEVYDPITDAWTVLPGTLSAARASLSAEVINGKIYVVGGYDGTAHATVDIYNPTTQTWSLAPSKITGVYGHGTAVIGYKMYAAGGSNHSSVLSILEVYEADPCAFTLIADLNGDCTVNLIDLAIMASVWLVDCNQLPLDVNCVPL